jgi:beta-lactamase superfamily II metal-dependent hydrolase
MLKVVVWDVQHGNATYIRTPNDKHIVIDLGIGSYNYAKASVVFSPLLHLRDKYGIKQLDSVIITHPHTDHIDDILNFDILVPKVLTRPKHLSEDDIREGNQPTDEALVDTYLEISTRYCSPVAQSANPLLAENNGGVTIQTFTPTSCGISDLNNHSIVTIVSFANCKMLIPGDNEPPSWNELLAQDDFVHAIQRTDIFLAPHHGRESGYSSELFKHINPRLTIISDGRFCETSATSRYANQRRGWTVYRRSGGTQKRKCVTTRSDGVIEVDFGKATNGNPYIKVTID